MSCAGGKFGNKKLDGATKWPKYYCTHVKNEQLGEIHKK